jgi:HD-GYP domain-containing protein (c-di-GMP phosphodiesterase class II)
VEARIFAVVDAYDAMVSERPYRKAVSPQEALAEIRAKAGVQFDPQVVEAFEAAVTRLLMMEEPSQAA